MREILFRGKQPAVPEWIEGFYLTVLAKNKVSSDAENIHLIIPFNFDVSASLAMSAVIVDPETVGQYTGLTDTNGNKIFEGDVVWNDYEEERGVVQWDDDTARFIITFSTFTLDFDSIYGSELEIIGNIYDDPELLKGGI